MLSFRILRPAMSDHQLNITARARASTCRTQSRSDAGELRVSVGMTGGIVPRHHRAVVYGRDAELRAVIFDIEERLARIQDVRTREFDDQLAAIEAVAAPYALAFLVELRRLERLLRRRFSRTVGESRRTIGYAIRRRRMASEDDDMFSGKAHAHDAARDGLPPFARSRGAKASRYTDEGGAK